MITGTTITLWSSATQWLTHDSTLWKGIERFSVLLSYVTLFTIIYGVWQLLKFIGKYKRSRERMKAVNGSSRNPRALAVSIGGTIETVVKKYLTQKYVEDIKVTSYNVEGELSPQNIHHHLEELKKIKNEFQADAVTELHLFCKGPVMLGVLLGALFVNWSSVKLYHNRAGQYEEWAMLSSAKDLPGDNRLATQIAEVIAKTEETNG